MFLSLYNDRISTKYNLGNVFNSPFSVLIDELVLSISNGLQFQLIYFRALKLVFLIIIQPLAFSHSKENHQVHLDIHLIVNGSMFLSITVIGISSCPQQLVPVPIFRFVNTYPPVYISYRVICSIRNVKTVLHNAAY